MPDCIKSIRLDKTVIIRNPKFIRPWQFVLDALNGYLVLAEKMWKNGKDFSRVHYDDYMGSIGYILYLTKHNWKYDWGGQLQILKDDVKTILPHPNRLVIINHSLKNPHWVTPTNKWSKEDRRTITGFCLKSGMSIPETWKNRKDISVKLWKEN